MMTGVTYTYCQEFGYAALLRKFSGSTISVLQRVLPSIEWGAERSLREVPVNTTAIIASAKPTKITVSIWRIS